MTEREKMINGELYDPKDRELEQLRLNARKLARKYNLTKIIEKNKRKYYRNCCLQQRNFRICKHPSTLIMDVILILGNTVLLILILHAYMYVKYI